MTAIAEKKKPASICPDCQKEIVGAKYLIRKEKKWVCMNCYCKEEFTN